MREMKAWYDATPKQKIERWENVLRVLKGLSPHERQKHWSMSDWVVKTECGTVACAAGHCGLDPWFRRRGFRMGVRYDDWTCPEDFFGYEGSTRIFYNYKKRPVSQVIKEVKAHIKLLKTRKLEEEVLGALEE
jgi:hypothetical protein